MQVNTVNLFDYVLIGLYLGVILWIGLYAARKSRNSDEYFRASGRMPWMLAGVSNWASGFTAYMFVVAAGFAYKNGISALILYTSPAWGYLVCHFFFAPVWRRSGIKAPYEFLTRRYSFSTTWFYSVLSIVPSVFNVGSGLYILCLFGSTAVGLNDTSVQLGPVNLAGWQLFVLILGTVLVLYSMAGGLWAAVISESLQSLIILVMVVVIFPVTFIHLGGGAGMAAGLSRLVCEAPEGFLTSINGPAASPIFTLCWVAAAVINMCTSIPMIQRYISVSTERDARKMAMLCAILALIGPMLWILPAMASKVIFPDIAGVWTSFPEPEEASFVGLALTLLPHGMLGFVVAAILSATLGTENALLNVLSSVITQDLYLPLRRRLGRAEPTEKHKVGFARLTILFIGVVGIILALMVPRLGGAFKLVAFMSTIVVGLAMPLGLGLLFRRTPWWSAFATCTAYIIFVIASELAGFQQAAAFERNMLGVLIICPGVFFITSLWWKPADPRNASILALDAVLRSPLPEEVETTSAVRPENKVFSVLGMLGLVFAATLIVCGFVVPSTPTVASSINFVAAALLAVIGGLLYWHGSAGRRPPA